jgi:hypothetical protein
MNMEGNGIEELLTRVRRVEAPPFLFTRIEVRITRVQRERMPRVALLAAACGLMLLLGANFIVVNGASIGSAEDTTEQLVDGMGMNPSNQLYQ